MEYKKYTICPTYADAIYNLSVINANRKRLGLIGDWSIALPLSQRKMINGQIKTIQTTKFWYKTPPLEHLSGTSFFTQTNEAPSTIELHNFKIYNYLNETAKEKYKDFSTPPHAVNYVIDLAPKLYHNNSEVFENGLLIEKKWYAYNYDTDRIIEEVINVSNVWYYWEQNPNATSAEIAYEQSLPLAFKTIWKRETKRNWVTLEGGYIDKYIKTTNKIYSTKITRQSEGERRRHNIFELVKKDMQIILFALVNTGNMKQTVSDMEVFFSEFANELSGYKQASSVIFDAIYSNTSFSWLDTIIPDDLGGLLSPDASFPIGFRDYIVKGLKGEINPKT